MAQAKITINAVAGSNDDLPINTIVQLNNLNVGGELTYAWVILTQPPGPSDLLSNSVIQNPTFTPKKEGTYLIKLTVNATLPSEQSDTQIVGIRLLKSRNRLPAPGETIQDSTTGGWAEPSMNTLLRGDDALLSNPPPFVGLNQSGGALAAGTVVQVTSNPTIKTGLPGQETVPGFVTAPATALANVDSLLGVVVSDTFGSTTVANGALMVVRYIGRYAGAPFTAAAGTPVYVSNTATLSTTAGTIQRQIGTVMGPGAVGGTSDVWLDAVGGFEITPINAPYLIFGAGGTLTNAFRVDTTTPTPFTGTVQFLNALANAANPLFQFKGAAGQTGDLSQWLNNAGTLLTSMDSIGSLRFKSSGSLTQGIYFPDWNILENANGDLTFTGNGNFNIARGGSVIYGTDGTRAWAVQSSGVGDVEFGATSNHPATFLANNTRYWQVTTAGALIGLGGNRPVQNVLDPVNPQDAATKTYADSERNFVINSRFDFWQRGSSFAVNTSGTRTAPGNPVTSAMTLLYTADRWECVTGSAATTATLAQANSGSTPAFPVASIAGLLATRGCRVQRNNANTGTDRIVLNQEIDRDFVKQMAGQQAVLVFWARVGANFSGASGHLNVQLATGTNTGGGTGLGGAPGTAGEDVISSNGVALAYNSGPATPLATTVTPTGTYQQFALSIPALGSGITEASLAFYWTPVGTAGANDWFEVSQVQLNPGASAAGAPPYSLAGVSEAGEIALCQRFYEKTYDLDTAPGSVGAAGEFVGSTPGGVVYANGTRYSFGPRFLSKKRATPFASFWRSNGTAGQWDIAGLAGAAGSVAAGAGISTGAIEVVNNSGANQTPTGDGTGHWAADAEI
jgi:hypothetical protein